MVQLPTKGTKRMDVVQIATVAFTSPDRVRAVLHNFNADGFDSPYPKYAGGRPATFTLPQRQKIKTWKTATDPDFEEEKNRVLHLYAMAGGKSKPTRGDPTVVVWMDDFGPLDLLLRPGRQWAPRIVKGEAS